MKIGWRMVCSLVAAAGFAWSVSCHQEATPTSETAAAIGMAQGFGMPLAEMAEAASCFPCHQKIVRKWSHHGMADAMGPLALERLPATPSAEWTSAKANEVSYRVAGGSKEGAWEMQMSWLNFPLNFGTQPKKQTMRSQEVVGRVGAGIRVMSLINGESGRWFFGPLEYVSNQGWELAPFEHFTAGTGLGMRITPDCLECHTSAPLQNNYPYHFMQQQVLKGIGCSACHGNTKQHVAQMTAHPESEDTRIVHPGLLEPIQQMDICARCHLEGDARIEMLPPAHPDFQLGDDLLARRAVAVSTNPGEDFGFVSQTNRLALSACFQNSTSMTCTTCHDPHYPMRLQSEERKNKSCLKCHADSQLHQTSQKGSCVKCHMPQRRPFDLDKVTIHDHYIRIPEEPTPLPTLRDNDSLFGPWKFFSYRGESQLSQGEKAVLLAMIYQTHGNAEKSAGYWKTANQAGWGKTLAALPMAHFMHGRTLADSAQTDKAAKAYATALFLDPNFAETRMNLAWTFLEQGKTADAILLAKELADAHPMAEAPWNLQMLAAQRQGKAEEAFYLLQESLRRYPEQASLWHHLAEILEHQDQKTEADQARARAEALGGLR